MRLRSDLPFWQVPLYALQEFDHGATIESLELASWNLQPGDCIEYEAGCAIHGIAEVVSVDSKLVNFWRGGRKVPGVKCKFRRRS